MTGDMIKPELSQKYGQTAVLVSCNAKPLAPIVHNLPETGENVAEIAAAVLKLRSFPALSGVLGSSISGVPTASDVFVQSGLAR